jgi:hypothetical protein
VEFQRHRSPQDVGRRAPISRFAAHDCESISIQAAILRSLINL